MGGRAAGRVEGVRVEGGRSRPVGGRLPHRGSWEAAAVGGMPRRGRGAHAALTRLDGGDSAEPVRRVGDALAEHEVRLERVAELPPLVRLLLRLEQLRARARVAADVLPVELGLLWRGAGAAAVGR